MVVELLGGGRVNVCEVGHRTHEAVRVAISLRGQPEVWDFPEIPERHAREFAMWVWDADRYAGHAGRYCPGQDEVSKAILEQHIWEGFATRVALEIMDGARDGQCVVDVGCHVGWYSLLALTGPRDLWVFAIDADPEHLGLVERTTAEWVRGTRLTSCRAWIGPDTPTMVDDGLSVRLAKIDIEGQEHEAVRVLGDLLRAGHVDYLMVEASPEFGDSAPMLRQLESYGYRLAVLPDKGDTIGDSALGACRPITAAGYAEQVTSQVMVLACRGGLPE